MRERPLTSVPVRWHVVLLCAALAQAAWHVAEPAPKAVWKALPPPPPAGVVRIAALGEDAVAARLLMLWLQASDSQAGGSVAFRDLDYERVIAWLDLILDVDPALDYPLLSASRVYGQVTEPGRQRQMLEFVFEAFAERPNDRWPWLAHAAVMARHKLEDVPLALRYARAITEYATGPAVPAWARDMSLLLLADIGEVEAAKVLLGGLVEAGRLTDPHELRFLSERLADLERQ